MTEKEFANELNGLLANTYALYLKTQSYHWHVKGISFGQLHSLFESHYQALAEAIDTIAERIVMMGSQAVASFPQTDQIKTLTDSDISKSSEQMLLDLSQDHQEILCQMKTMLDEIPKHDLASVNLLSDRIIEHETMSWMLQASVD